MSTRRTYSVPPGCPAPRCKGAGCNCIIYFVATPNQKAIAVDAEGTPHAATCPNSPEFRERVRLERRLAELRAEAVAAKGGV